MFDWRISSNFALGIWVIGVGCQVLAVTFSNQRPRKETCDRCQVLGVRCWVTAVTQGAQKVSLRREIQRVFSTPLLLRSKSVSSPFLKMGLTGESQGSQLGGTWESLRISNRDQKINYDLNFGRVFLISALQNVFFD